MAPTVETWAEWALQGQGRDEVPPVAQVQLTGQPAVTSSQRPPPAETQRAHTQFASLNILNARASQN